MDFTLAHTAVLILMVGRWYIQMVSRYPCDSQVNWGQTSLNETYDMKLRVSEALNKSRQSD